MVRDMMQGNPLKVMTIFAIPMFIGSVFQQVYNLVDSMVVGKYVETKLWQQWEYAVGLSV